MPLRMCGSLAAVASLLSMAGIGWAAVSKDLLTNGAFDGNVRENGLPGGWGLYGGQGNDQSIAVIDAEDGKGKIVRMVDGDPTAEIGLTQQIPVNPGETYEASVEVRPTERGSYRGAHLQLRFQPSNQFSQTSFRRLKPDEFRRVSTKGTAPKNARTATVYLYTHRTPTPSVLLRNARIVSGVKPPPSPPPPAIPPQYGKLKDLHIDTPLAVGGKPTATIIVPADGRYDALAKRIQKVVEDLTGVTLPIAKDDEPAAAVPVKDHLVVVGNRSTNQTIAALYERYFTLLDLRYPGPGGHIVRTLHNPFGNGHNVVFVGGSDAEGLEKATATFAECLQKARHDAGRLTIGRLAEITLGKGVSIPRDVEAMKTWEASKGYGSVGYFGWNSISKRMAAYYMTGDPFHAKEFLRLAFPDEKAKKEIARIDGERIENKDDPLAGPYHYNAHLMILFWDLIEESPVFTDAQRLRVTNAFARQLNHRKGEGIYRLRQPPAHVGSRHGQWSALSLYCLGRYFQKDYPNPIWAQCVRGGALHFAPLHEHAWVSGENDNLFWYNTAIAPIFTYLVLTGDRVPIENGVVEDLLRGQEILASGRRRDWALNTASIGFLHKAAHLTGDGRWLAYRHRTGVDLDVTRLGQSYWPGPALRPAEPKDLVGTWSIQQMPEEMWWWRENGFALEESFLFGSFRNTTDAAGDYILIDGFNGASRNPYHTFAILELRIAGHKLLEGYRNQVIVRDGGMVEPHIAMNAALKECDVLGGTVFVTAEVPDASFCSWQRTLVQRIGRYAIIVDELTFRVSSDTMQVELLWETPTAPKIFPDGHVEFSATAGADGKQTVSGGQIRCCDVMQTRRDGKVTTMTWTGAVKKGERKVFYTLVGIEPGADKTSLACARVGVGGATLVAPVHGLVAKERREDGSAFVVLQATDHCFGRSLKHVMLPTMNREERIHLRAAPPIDLDWDLDTGTLAVCADQPCRLELNGTDCGPVRLNGKPLDDARLSKPLALPKGRHTLEPLHPHDAYGNTWKAVVEGRLEQGRKRMEQKIALRRTQQAETEADMRELRTVFGADIGGAVADMEVVPRGTAANESTHRIYVAEGKTVHVLDAAGKEIQSLRTDGRIRVIRWWAEHRLLLAGCADEKVIAFDAGGKRKWTFVSEMDPAVFRAAKTYWFKSAPGHEGIHGLHTGVFLDGKSQAFVGSACTLEILDANGKLLHRMPQFWGKVSHFVIVDGPEGSLNLLASRKYNGTNRVGILNNKTLDPKPRGFHTVPAGATYVPGWSAMNRYHLFYEDLDGDGTKEVISEINGVWNRVTVWSASGRPLYDASFGPGKRISSRRDVKSMRDLDVGNLDGGKTQEIVTATSSGMVIALDHQCKKLWARKLDAPATVLACATQRIDVTETRRDTPPGSTRRAVSDRPWLAVGCEDGTVLGLDGRGRPILRTMIRGRPTCIDAYASPRGSVVVIATSKGRVRGFMPPTAPSHP